MDLVTVSEINYMYGMYKKCVVNASQLQA